MSNLEQHIARLLVHHNCVILPRFGGLIASFQSARINEESGIIMPPFKEIIFNKSLSHNDGLLINSYAEQFQMSYSESEQAVAALVESIHYRILNGESVALGGIGIFRMDSNKNIHFLHDRTSNLLGQSFGFEAIQMIPLTSVSKKLYDARAARSRIFVRMVTNPRVAASIAASVGLFLFSTGLSIKELDNYSYSALFNNSESKEIVTLLQMPEPSVGGKESVSKVILVSAEEDFKIKQSSEYHLIAGSFTTKDDAEQILLKFRKLGKSNALVLAADSRFRLSLEQFSSKELALNQMKRYRKDLRYRDVWVYHQK